MMRPISASERAAILLLSGGLPQGEKDRVLLDLEAMRGVTVSPDGGWFTFHLAGYERPNVAGRQPFPVEGSMKDSDGGDMTVLLHADANGRLWELELVRWGEGEVISPKWSTLTVD